jgi:hypothetical protein
MWNRWSLLVLGVGALTGYAVGGPSLRAQDAPLPFTVGETVTLWYSQDASIPSFGQSVQCTVAEIRGTYVKCGPRSRIGGGTDRSERWLTLKYVVQITKSGD